MAFGGSQVDETAFAQKVDLAAIFERVLFDEIASGTLGGSHPLKRRNVDLDVEVPGIRNDRAILHHFEMLPSEHALIAGHSTEHIANGGGLGHRHYAEAIHHRFERLGWVNLGDDHLRPSATRATSQPASAPAVARDHELRSGKQKIRSPDNAIDRGLPGAVAVVEQVLGIRIV